MLAAENLTDLVVLITLPQLIACIRRIVLQAQYVEGGSLLRAACRSLLLEGLHLFGLTLALIIHKLPAFEVAVVFLDPS